MTTFYDHDGTRITSQWMFVGQCRYRIDQLSNLRMTRGPSDQTTLWAAAVAALSLVVIVVVERYGPLPNAMPAATVFVALPATVAVVRARLHPREYLLWADYHEFTVQLHRTRNETEFGKISRALLRACPGRGRLAVPARSRLNHRPAHCGRPFSL